MSSTPLIIGQLASPYGIKGWLKVTSFTEAKETILNYQPWQFYLNDNWILIPVKATRLIMHQPIIQLEGCNNPEDARRYTGTKIGIESNQLPLLSSGEYYWSELTGLSVITTKGILLGKVDHLFETGANDVLVVIGERKRLIPYLPKQVIQKVDLNNQQIIVDWDADF